jgi:hypothetical protein
VTAYRITFCLAAAGVHVETESVVDEGYGGVGSRGVGKGWEKAL